MGNGAYTSRGNTQALLESNLTASLRQRMRHVASHDAGQAKFVRIMRLTTDLPTEVPIRAECGDVLEFTIKEKDPYDIVEVQKEGEQYYPVQNGLRLFNISTTTKPEDRRFPLSFELPERQQELDLYFRVSPSSYRKSVPKSCTWSDIFSTINWIRVGKRRVQIVLNDKPITQKVYLHKGDTVELRWSSNHGVVYHIEERKYCPVSCGLYTPPHARSTILSEGGYKQTFDEYGMSFLFRFTDTNRLHDIVVCIVNQKYLVKHVAMADTIISPNPLWIEQNEWILFGWNARLQLILTQLELYYVAETELRQIELATKSTPLLWPNQRACLGYAYYQFTKTGVYYYKTTDNQVGTIIVKPETSIHQVRIFQNKAACEIKTNDFLQFDWGKGETEEEPVLITMDLASSIGPNAHDDFGHLFGCNQHRCNKVEPFFRHHFHACETFIFQIPHYGLYNFIFASNPDYAAISAIVEVGIKTHLINFDEEDVSKRRPLQINCLDQVLFQASSDMRTIRIYETDRNGFRLQPTRSLFQSPSSSIQYVVRTFPKLGAYYYSTDSDEHEQHTSRRSTARPLTITVLPKPCFRVKTVAKSQFDSRAVMIASVTDFIVWKFEKAVSHNVVELDPSTTFKHLSASRESAKPGKTRWCLAVNCKALQARAHFFCNPEFERVFGSYQDRLISTVIVDRLCDESSFTIKNGKCTPRILYVAEDETVSWLLADDEPTDLVYPESTEGIIEDTESSVLNGNYVGLVDKVYHVHTFDQLGRYYFRSDRFHGTVTVIVVPRNDVRNGQLRKPDIAEEIDPTTPAGTQVHIICQDHRETRIWYTFNGSFPRPSNPDALRYDRNAPVTFRQAGLCVLRASAKTSESISSLTETSSPTLVTQGQGMDAAWDDIRISLRGSIHGRNQIHGEIEIEPDHASDLIDHFQLFIDGKAQNKTISKKSFHYTAPEPVEDVRFNIRVDAKPHPHLAAAHAISSNTITIHFSSRSPPSVPLPVTPTPPEPSHAEDLLEKLREAVLKRSHEFNYTHEHPHSSFPGFPHYDDKRTTLKQSSSSSHHPYTAGLPPKSVYADINDSVK